MKVTTVDVDGHVAEPISLIMKEYLEPKFKDRPIRLLLDGRGLEYAEIDGRKSPTVYGGQGISLDAGKGFGVDDLSSFFVPGKVRYEEATIPASNESGPRVHWMDEEGIDISSLYPTLGLFWEDGCQDPRAAAAYCRAYNDWIVDMCRPYPGRLIPVAHIPTKDVDEAVKEVKRTAKLGVKGFMVCALPANGRYYGDPYFDPMFAEVQDTDLPMGIHPTAHRDYIGKEVHKDNGEFGQALLDDYWYALSAGGFRVQVHLLSLINRGTFDRFPNLKVVFLEAGGTWGIYWLERMQERWEVVRPLCKFELSPDEYFQRQCWISFEPDEKVISHVISEIGADKFFWASDFPHADGFPGIVDRVKKSIEPLSEEDQQKVLGENALKVYKMT